MIKILLDQNIPSPIESWLQNLVGNGAEISSTRTLGMQRMTDEEIFYFCQQQQMVIITYDEDFQNPLVIPDIPGYGVIRLNIYPTGLRQTQQALHRLLASHPVDTWEKASIGYENKTYKPNDGILIIGDRSFGVIENYKHVTDLSLEWRNFTKLPFVFAAWVANKSLPKQFIAEFNQSLKYGISHIKESIELYGTENYNINVENYLNENIDYHLNDKKKEAMQLFLNYCSQL